jgi:hypothetical protein
MNDAGYIADMERDARIRDAAHEMLAVLHELDEYLDQRADVNWKGTGPNKAMSLLTEVRAAIAKAGGK